MSWNPEQYLKFADQRLRPALDLLTRIEADDPETVYDLGCGAGNVTEFLIQRWPGARVTGLDSSAEMLASARARLPRMNWEQVDLAHWLPSVPASILYSNAALHWLDHHWRLFPALYAGLAQGGTLAVQMPHNHSQPSHSLLHQAAQDPRWREILAPYLRPSPVERPDDYWRMLQSLGARLDIWECDYLQVLTGEDAVLQWMMGTTLRPLLAVLGKDQQPAFLDLFRALLRTAYPRESDGSTLFPFRRLFILATKPE